MDTYYFARHGNIIRIFKNGINVDCEVDHWPYTKANEKQLINMGYIKMPDIG